MLAGAGLSCSTFKVRDDTYVAVSGPTALTDADALYRSAPTRFVAPAVGMVADRYGLGIYVVSKGLPRKVGSVEEAKRALSPIFGASRRLPDRS